MRTREIRDSEAELGRGWWSEVAEQRCGTKRDTMMCTVMWDEAGHDDVHGSFKFAPSNDSDLSLGTNRREFEWAVSNLSDSDAVERRLRASSGSYTQPKRNLCANRANQGDQRCPRL